MTLFATNLTFLQMIIFCCFVYQRVAANVNVKLGRLEFRGKFHLLKMNFSPILYLYSQRQRTTRSMAVNLVSAAKVSQPEQTRLRKLIGCTSFDAAPLSY